jgi:hypothetical protein
MKDVNAIIHTQTNQKQQQQATASNICKILNLVVGAINVRNRGRNAKDGNIAGKEAE